MKAFVVGGAVGGLIACLIVVSSRAADCVAPLPPAHLPSGATATREEMVEGMQAIRDYEAAVKAFSKCADRINDQMLMQTADQAVDKVRAMAEKFNSELYVFKKRNLT